MRARHSPKCKSAKVQSAVYVQNGSVRLLSARPQYAEQRAQAQQPCGGAQTLRRGEAYGMKKYVAHFHCFVQNQSYKVTKKVKNRRQTLIFFFFFFSFINSS